MEKRTFVILLILASLVVLPFASSEILFSQPEDIYSIGDSFSLEVTLKPNSASNDFLIMDLFCGNKSVNLYRNVFNLNALEERKILIDAFLGPSVVGDLRGSCFFEAAYSGERAQSQRFEISSEIEIDLDFERGKLNPGEDINVEGEALKKNGVPVNGFVEIKSSSLGVSISKPISNGVFNFNFTVPNNALSGEHFLNVRIYERSSSGLVSNEGFSNESSVQVNQVLKNIEITTSSLEVAPGEEITYTIKTYDQSDTEMAEEIGVVIYEPGDFVFQKRLISSGEQGSLEVSLDNVPGYWKIEAAVGDLKNKKLFYVKEHEEALFSLINKTLIISNVGNVIYDQNVEISIGSTEEVKHVKLGIGESQKFELFAPDGNYLIGIADGSQDLDLGNTFLTGRVVGVSEIREGILNELDNPLLWGLGVLILLVIFALVYVKNRKRNPKIKKEKIQKADIQPAPVKKNTQTPFRGKPSDSIKENATIVALKLNNSLTAHSMMNVEKALKTAQATGSKVYVDGNYRIIVLSPSLTKEKDNSIIGVKLAKRIEEILIEHNRRYKEKIDFGIGVSEGKIISELSSNEFKFTSVDNLIILAKKIANSSQQEALLSDSMHRKVINQIKTEKLPDKDFWRIKKITDRTKHESFINRFKGKK